MKKSILPCLLITFSAFLNAAPSAKGPDSGSLMNAPVIRAAQDAPEISDAFASGRMISEISADELPAFNEAADGTKFMLLRFQSQGASAVRLHFSSVRLGSNTVFVYGVDSNGNAAVVHGPFSSAGPLQTEQFWTPAIAGDQVVVEFQVNGDVPAQLPFRVDVIGSADPSLVADSNAVSGLGTAEIRTSKYRGVTLTHAVRDGLAIYENDIVLGRADDLERADPVSSKGHEHEGVGVSIPQTLWPNGAVPYAVDPSIPNQDRITAAVAAWNNALGGVIQIIPRTSQSSYMYFSRAANAYMCSSPIGYIGYGPQYTMLGDACATGNVIHEIGHQLGLWHEHTRTDRNSHIVVNYQNIDPNDYYNFNQSLWNSQDLGSYDFDSIMHYPAYALSTNGQPTIVTIPAGIPIGQRDHLSAGDVNAVLQLYGGVPRTPVVQQFTVTINGNPPGTQLIVDGAVVATPYSTQWTDGSSHTISATSQYIGAGAFAQFSSWSDGGAASHNVVASAGSPVITANFVMWYSLTTAVLPAGAGSVTVNPAATMFAANSTVGLVANAAQGYCFSSWSGLISGTAVQTSVSMTQALSVIANFVPCTPPPPTVSNSGFTPIRVHAGGPPVLDAKGQLWSGDYGYDLGSTYAKNVNIANTDSPALYQTERWAWNAVTYSFNVPAGTYNVTLKFAEIYYSTGGFRSFNVVINGQQVLTNFDPGLAAGGSYIAVDRTFSVPAVNGTISITLVPVISNPKISAIEITQ